MIGRGLGVECDKIVLPVGDKLKKMNNMIETVSESLVDWLRTQFAMTEMYLKTEDSVFKNESSGYKNESSGYKEQASVFITV